MKHKYPLTKKCEWCDGTFVIQNSHQNWDRRFCNLSCSSRWHWVYRYSAMHKLVTTNGKKALRNRRLRLRCDACGKAFVKKHPNQVWCSKSCGQRTAHQRYYAKPGKREMARAHEKERWRLEKMRRKEHGERTRAEIAAMLSSRK